MSLGEGFEVSKSQARPSGSLSLLLPADSDIEFSTTTTALCLPAYHHVFHNGDNNELTLWNCKPVPVP